MRDFRLHLQFEFSKRVRKNSRYSLRAFASALDISPSALSAILREKRPLTDKMIVRLSTRMGLSPKDAKKYLKRREIAAPTYQQLENDEFEILSNGVYNAILELMKTSDFDPSDLAIAKRLQTPVNEIKFALERLQRLGLIEQTREGFRDLTPGFTSRLKENYTDSARKAMQVSLREKAIRSVAKDPVHLRNHTSMTFAVDVQDLPEAYELIKNFRRDMDRLFALSEKKTEVYQLAVSLFPLSEREEKTK